jgi:hypothetical protein
MFAQCCVALHARFDASSFNQHMLAISNPCKPGAYEFSPLGHDWSRIRVAFRNLNDRRTNAKNKADPWGCATYSIADKIVRAMRVVRIFGDLR